MNEVCRKCNNFDPNRNSCELGHSMNVTLQDCPSFIRYMNLLPPIKPGSKSILSIDTNRGTERAIPAYPELDLYSKTNDDGSIDPVYTYQGQRELIFQYGVKIASEIANEKGMRLYVLQHEQNEIGISEYIRRYYEHKHRAHQAKDLYWMSDSPVEVW